MSRAGDRVRSGRWARWARPGRRWSDAGALTLSYVIVFPIFLLGIMTIAQASVWYLAKETALAAARHGADVARTSQPPPGDGAAAALTFARAAAPGFLTDVSANTKGSTADTIRITVTGRAPSLVPGTPITVTEVVTAPVERFVSLGGAAGGSGASGWVRRVADARGR
jgi:Flp pilus assembly protein TadG